MKSLVTILFACVILLAAFIIGYVLLRPIIIDYFGLIVKGK